MISFGSSESELNNNLVEYFQMSDPDSGIGGGGIKG